MRKIDKIALVGEGEEVERIGDLFRKAGLAVSTGAQPDQGGLAGAGLVIEAASHAQRKEALRRCAELAEEAILATTATAGITGLASTINIPGRFAGLHFTFNPFQDGCLVEIVRGLDTSVETIEACRELLTGAGARAVVTDDLPGLVLDRVMASAINEAAAMVVSGVASVEDIDRVAKSCLNWPAGPFELADIIGIDSVLSTLELLSREASPMFLPCRLLKQMAAAGRLGRKAGRGFYTYG